MELPVNTGNYLAWSSVWPLIGGDHDLALSVPKTSLVSLAMVAICRTTMYHKYIHKLELI